MSLHLETLNTEQHAAVTYPDAHVLILAGAGSGKTRVLTTRIAWLVKSGLASPGAILAVTFTNKAAREMVTRLSAMLPVNPRGLWIGTFHGLCNRLLRAHHRDAGLPQTFQILDTQDQLSLVKRLLKSLNVDEDRFPPREVQWFIAARKEEGERPTDITVVDERSRKLAEVYAAYDETCRKEGVVDFAELLLRSYELLSRNEILRTHYANRFRHILVDEFQDTNRLQYRWLKLLAGATGLGAPADGARLFCVGDDDQSIYAFRGANVGNMADFERDFRVEKVIRLEQNYRSHGHILNAANALIEHNRGRLGKNLWTDRGDGEPIRVHEAESDGGEAAWLVDEARALARDGMRLADMAVLYRSNAQSRVIEHALFGAGIAYRVYGGLRFFERAEVKHALAYLRLVMSPADDNAFLRIVNFPPRGIGGRSLEQIQDLARAQSSSLWDAAALLQGRPAPALATFRTLISELKEVVEHLPLAEAVEHVIARSGLVEHFRAEREGADRVENLGELVNAAAAFDAQERTDGIETGAGDEEATTIDSVTAFLTHAALEAGEHQAGEGQDALQMMTVHAAKGLEFDAVFITGIEEGLFPHEQSAMEKDGLEEERRLAYVAITRARKRLYLSFAQTRMLHGQTRYSLPSRFIEELPAELLKWLTPRVARGERFAGGAWGRDSDESNAGRTGGWVRGPSGGARPGGSLPVYSSASSARVVSDYAKAKSQGFGAANGPGAFRIGQNVSHAKFGVGVIVDAEGSGNDARVQVNFARDGVKWLAVSIAKLQAA